MSLPLHGIRVLDLSRVLAGPLASMILGDLGADVLKVERPGTGDESRGWGPPFDARGESAYYLSCNRNKLSIAADFDSPDDRAMLAQLISGADVIIDNFRPGMLSARELDPLGALEQHPRLIWCTITGFGAGSTRAGYDFVVQAESGWMSITGDVEGSPSKVGVALVDVITGKDAAIAILAMLAGRAAGGPRPAAERRLSVSLRQSAVSSLMNVAQNVLVTGTDAARWGNAHANLVPYQLFDAADRAIVIAVGSDAQFASLARALDLESLLDPRFATNAGRLAHRSEIVAAIRGRMATRSAAEWVAVLDAAGVASGVVRSVLEALRDVSASPTTGVAPLAPAVVRRAPPTLDEHGPLVRAHGWDAFARMSV